MSDGPHLLTDADVVIESLVSQHGTNLDVDGDRSRDQPFFRPGLADIESVPPWIEVAEADSASVWGMNLLLGIRDEPARQTQRIHALAATDAWSDGVTGFSDAGQGRGRGSS